jgi:hypothetical protein
MSVDLEPLRMRLAEALGTRLGRPLAERGVLTTSRPLAMSADNLAALEAVWRFAGEAEPARPEE